MGTFPRGINPADRILQSRELRATKPVTATNVPNPTFTSKLPGDTQALRGIPAIGRGVTGAIPGTIPHAVCQAGVSSTNESAVQLRL